MPSTDLTDSHTVTHLLSFCVKPCDMGQMKQRLWTSCMSGAQIVCQILSKYLTSTQRPGGDPGGVNTDFLSLLLERGMFRDSKEKQNVTVRVLSRHTESAECGCIH